MEQRIRTFHPRRSRMSPTAADALERLLPARSVTPEDFAWVPSGGLLLEIGAGMGESALQWARANPQTLVLAVDVHTPGMGRLLRDAEGEGLTNVRVHIGDAVPLIETGLPDGCLLGVRILYPDPWPKARHHKRRLIQRAFLESVSRPMAPGASLHLATDWPDYAEQMVREVGGCAAFAGLEATMTRAMGRPETGFERKAIRAGRTSTDIVAFRQMQTSPLTSRAIPADT